MQTEHPTDAGRRSARKDRRYVDTPLGVHAVRYLSIKGKKLSDPSYRGYEACLAELCMHYPDRDLSDFEPPRGTELLEDFLAGRWGHRSPRTYNKNLSILSDFFKWHVLRETLNRDATLPIEKTKKVAVYRTVFSTPQKEAILAAACGPHERIAIRLLLSYGIRKGTLQRVRFGHFNRERRHISLFTKGSKVQTLQLPQQVIWDDLTLIGDVDPENYLVPRQKLTKRPVQIRRAAALRDEIEALQVELAGVEAECEWVRFYPAEKIGDHALHDLWYRWLTRAGVVADGVTRGAKMHGARHSAGQHVLDTTGNLKAVQEMLGHASSNTTAEHYVEWDGVRLAETLAAVITL